MVNWHSTYGIPYFYVTSMQFITKDFKQLSLEELEEVRKEFRFVWLPSIVKHRIN